jgi:L-alanine-DL-glutamate epimerase-like enolase superfamily enzyme
MRISEIETFILHVPVTRNQIEDSTHSITHWGVPGVIITTDTGLQGTGYTGTHAHLPTDRQITQCIKEAYSPLLFGEDPLKGLHLWNKIYHYPPIQWVGRSGITHLALSVVDIALWDIRAKVAGLPLWKLLGGSERKQIQAYNTDGGWLNWSIDMLVADVRKQIEVDGFQGVKIKVGNLNLDDDIQRIAAVRKAIGPRVKLMIDANGRYDLPTAINIGRHLPSFDIEWFEEPLWYNDLSGHTALARSISTPIALGEQLYNLDSFRDFISLGAVHYVQADAVRLAGITEWWQVADLALAYRLPVVPHIGDMMQVHLHLVIAHPACRMLEYIPWLTMCFEEPAIVQDGFFLSPEAPGAGTTFRPKAFLKYRVS